MADDIKNWYYWHKPIMEYRDKKANIPWKNEAALFLTLTPTQQRKYIKDFWSLRLLEFNAEEEYNNRIKLAKAIGYMEYKEGYLTDRGWLILRAGLPFDVNSWKTDFWGDFEPIIEDESQFILTDKPHYFQAWSYWFPGRGFLTQKIDFIFYY
ncbi:MAG: GWxTD domain-containing protein, partial [Candidatus Omnitrophica bacterium]|nr:GWxTD domain-containing protein [Candidatus Omnitrophota bacterium]